MGTRAAKIRYWRLGLAEISAALLAVCAGPLFNQTGLQLDPPTVEFPAGVTEAPGEIAQTLALLQQAEAASIETKVRMLHPDWDKAQVAAEVDAIKAEGGRSVADPTQIGDEQPMPDAAPGQDPGDEDPDRPDEGGS
jgi:hypothetical protein